MKLLFLQETKKEVISKELCFALWGDIEFWWGMNPSINSTGGLLCAWNKDTFHMNNVFRGHGFIGLEGVWLDGLENSHW